MALLVGEGTRAHLQYVIFAGLTRQLMQTVTTPQAVLDTTHCADPVRDTRDVM